MANKGNSEDFILKLKLPLFVEVGASRYHINLNNYHLWHRYRRNEIKQHYQNLILPQIPKRLVSERVKLKLVMHRGDRRKVDRSNVLCLHEKFAVDALVKAGFLEDDSDKFVESSHYYTGEVCKSDPRVELFVKVANGD